MDSFRSIRAFLDVVRRRLQGRATRAAALWTGVGLVLLLALAPLVAAAARPTRAAGLRTLGLLLAGAAIVAAIVSAVRARRRWANDPDVARAVGAAAPEVASDLLSSVQLEDELSGTPRFSRDLALALSEATASRVAALEPRRIVPEAPVHLAGRVLAGAVGAHLLLALIAPRAMAEGWRRLIDPPDRAGLAGGAQPVPEPLVGDVTITLTYPAHTGRPPVTLPSSSGDLAAPRGTQVAIETTALRPAAEARMVFDAAAGGAEVAMTLEGRVLRGSFKLDRAGAYRFLIVPPTGRPLLEAEPHRVELEPDRAPRVELIAPADELEVSARKRVELAYDAEDDYGLKDLTLVWRGPSGRDERKALPAPAPGARSAQGKHMWDLSDVPLPPGARVAYHLEARDNDEISGPNVGVSRTYYLRVFSPRERHDEVLARHAAVLEQAIALLGDRLEAAAQDTVRRRDLNQGAQRLVVELGQLVTEVERDQLATKGLKEELDAMRGRLEKLSRDEQVLLDDLDARAARATDRALSKTQLDRLVPSDAKQIAELEKDVLILDDWLARQQLEQMLSTADEIRQRQERLERLMDDYARTGSEALRAEIERELKALADLQAELMTRQRQLAGEVSDRFLNADANEAQHGGDCLQEVRDLLAHGDAAGAAARLKRCNEQLEAAAQAMEDGLRGLRGERFSAEEKAFGELMDQLSELELAERDLAREAGELQEKYRRKAAEATRDRTNPMQEKARRTLEKLQQELSEVPREGLTPFAQEEHDAVKQRLEDVKRMLDEGDVAEALAMAREAENGLAAVEAELEDDAADGQTLNEKSPEASERVSDARPRARELVEQLEQATPSPDDILSNEDKQQLQALRDRQQLLRERAQKLAQQAGKRAGELPQRTGEAGQQGLGEVEQQMERSAKRLGQNDAQGGRQEAEGAADQLGKLRQRMQQASRPTPMEGEGRGAMDQDDVRIPGAEEYRPPEEFREDILEAKRRGDAPEGWDDQVDRYYEELVR